MCVVVCVSTFSNIFSTETNEPTEDKFYVELLWDGETEVCSNGPGHMTNMAAMLIRQSSPEPKDR